jgi:anti-sigma B factor antagonist
MSEPVAVVPVPTPARPGLDAVRIEERGGAAVVTVRGGIDAGSASLMRDSLTWAVGCHERVVVDLSRAARLDRTGLSVLIAAQDRADSRAVQLCFTAPSAQLLAALCDLRAGEALAAVDRTTPRPAPPGSGPAGFTLPGPTRLPGFLPS